jgi:hypothetical protein
VYHCALKIPKFFLNIFLQGKTPTPFFYTAFGEASGKGGAFYVKHVSGLHRGPEMGQLKNVD